MPDVNTVRSAVLSARADTRQRARAVIGEVTAGLRPTRASHLNVNAGTEARGVGAIYARTLRTNVTHER